MLHFFPYFSLFCISHAGCAIPSFQLTCVNLQLPQIFDRVKNTFINTQGLGGIKKQDKLNGRVDPDSLNKAMYLLFGLALGINAKDNPTMLSSI